jgi:Cu/Zn superoxide dismutase
MVNGRDGYSNTIKLQTNVSSMLMKTNGPLTFHIQRFGRCRTKKKIQVQVNGIEAKNA